MSLGSLGSTVGKETVSSSGTRYYPETLDSSSFQTPPAKHKPCLDASGFPVFNDIHCVTAKQSEQQGDEEQGAVVDGKSRRHKAATIEARKRRQHRRKHRRERRRQHRRKQRRQHRRKQLSRRKLPNQQRRSRGLRPLHAPARTTRFCSGSRPQAPLWKFLLEYRFVQHQRQRPAYSFAL